LERGGERHRGRDKGEDSESTLHFNLLQANTPSRT
jgi:hypothetical protein